MFQSQVIEGECFISALKSALSEKISICAAAALKSASELIA